MNPLDRCAQVLARHADAEGVAIRALDEDGQITLVGHAGRAAELLVAADHCGVGDDSVCGRVARGQIDPGLDCFTSAGSFSLGRASGWPPELRTACLHTSKPCGCAADNIESLLVVALRSPGRTVGLVQLLDSRPQAFSARTVAFVERLALEIGSAVDTLRIATVREQMSLRLSDTTERVATAIRLVCLSQSFEHRIDNPRLAACWRVRDCDKEGCPAYGSADRRCWLLADSFCHPADLPPQRRDETCRACEVYQTARPDQYWEITEDFNSMLAALKREAEQVSSLQQQMIGAEKLTALGQLVSGVAHELNNPLAAVIGFAKALLADPRCPSWLAEDLRQIDDNAERCRHIVGDLLDFARKHEPEAGEVDLNAVLRRAVGMVEQHLHADGIELCWELAPELPRTAGDAHQLERVFFNIAHNALQALSSQPQGSTGSAAPRLTVRSTCDPDRPEGGEQWLRLEICDNGPGMPVDVVTRLFEPFFTTKPVGQGTGLGLSIAHGIVSSHGGHLLVDSSPGRGASFTVELPLRQPDARPGRASAAATSLEGICVLVIDDEAPIRRVAQRLLNLSGAQVELADSGQEGLEQLAGKRYDCVLLDVRMAGGLDGLQTFKRICAQRPDVAGRVLFMSGDIADAEVRALARQSGCALLAKPFDIAELVAAVHRAATPVSPPQP